MGRKIHAESNSVRNCSPSKIKGGNLQRITQSKKRPRKEKAYKKRLLINLH